MYYYVWCGRRIPWMWPHTIGYPERVWEFDNAAERDAKWEELRQQPWLWSGCVLSKLDSPLREFSLSRAAADQQPDQPITCEGES